MKIAILVGTRPEIIKMSPLIRLLEKLSFVELVIIHSNQHYSPNMDAIFFEELELKLPDYNLNVGKGANSNQIGNIMIGLEPVLVKEQVDVLLVQGDTNTVAAGAMVASKLDMRLGHVEAGLRSYDRSMPEEGNRVITDHLSDYLFAVTETQVDILLKEGLPKKRISKVGNTIVDAVYNNLEIAKSKSTILSKLNLKPQEYTLFTAHRASNVDTKQALQETVEMAAAVSGKVCWPIHLRTKANLEKFNIDLPKNIVALEPVGFFDFLLLEHNAKMIITDSGGLQEEACILGVPCITIRENTERPETVDVGANRLVGRDLTKLKKAIAEPYLPWRNPFGDGKTSEKIIDTILEDFGLPAIQSPVAKNETIVMIGLGYMGIPTACMLAGHGYNVVGFDINSKKVEQLNNGVVPFDEPGMKDLLSSALNSKRFRASSKIMAADVFIIAVPTPHQNGKCDLSYVLSAAETVAQVAKDGDLVIIESTIKPNTSNDFVRPIFDKKNIRVEIVHCPERAIPGNTLYEIVHNDRIIGGDSSAAVGRARSIYESFVKGEIFTTSLINAECAKLIENTFRDVNIAFANEIAVISKDIGFDAKETIRLANRHPRVNILEPGVGVGGHCIPIDPWFLTENTDKARLIRSARLINDHKPIWSVEQFIKKYNLKPGTKIGLMGLSYKKDVDDTRESPAQIVIDELKKLGFEIKLHDPHIINSDLELLTYNELCKWADIIAVVTKHSVFAQYEHPQDIKVVYLE